MTKKFIEIPLLCYAAGFIQLFVVYVFPSHLTLKFKKRFLALFFGKKDLTFVRVAYCGRVNRIIWKSANFVTYVHVCNVLLWSSYYSAVYSMLQQNLLPQERKKTRLTFLYRFIDCIKTCNSEPSNGIFWTHKGCEIGNGWHRPNSLLALTATLVQIPIPLATEKNDKFYFKIMSADFNERSKIKIPFS